MGERLDPQVIVPRRENKVFRPAFVGEFLRRNLGRQAAFRVASTTTHISKKRRPQEYLSSVSNTTWLFVLVYCLLRQGTLES